jgi:Bacterial regulatory helix-turn-helix protein, lysR family
MTPLEDLALLRAFVCIVESGSISAAARRLKVPQPSLSRRLRMLEDNCGVVLLRCGAPAAWCSCGVVLLRRGAPAAWCSCGVVLLRRGAPAAWCSFGVIRTA